MYFEMNTYNKDQWFRFWQEKVGNGGWGHRNDQSVNWITRCIYGPTGGNDHNKIVISILRGREAIQKRRQINARESHRIVSRAKKISRAYGIP